MKLILLAGGKGERLRPITETRPKPLLPILAEPIGCRQARIALSSRSFDEVVVVYSYMGDKVVEGLRECLDRLGVDPVFVDQRKPLGTGHAVLRAIEETGLDDALIVYSDVYLPESAIADLASMTSPSILVGVTDRPWEYGVVEVAADGYVTGLREKPPRSEAPERAYVFIGVAALAKEHLEMLQDIKPSERGEYELTDVLARLALQGELRAVRLSEEAGWRDIGRPWDLLLANRQALSDLKPSVRGDVHPTAVVEGPVVVEEGAVIKPHTVIEGPAYIGAGAVVGPSAYVRPGTVILDGARAGFSVEVKASIMMEGARASHLSYIGDSIIGEGVNLGAGTVTANLRFDKKTIKMNVKGERVDTGLEKLGAVVGGYAQTGINVSIMPGVKIGSYAVIYPHCVVASDIPRGARFKCREA